MEVAAAFTVWLTFGGWLFLGTVPAPAAFGRTALALCGAELLAVLIWSVGTENCDMRPCAAVPEAARTAAALDIPALTGVALALAAAYGLCAAARA